MKIFLGVFAVAFIAALWMLGAAAIPQEMTPDERAAAERARVAEIEAEHQARMDEIEHDRATQPVRKAATTVAFVSVLLVPVALVVGGIYFGVRRRDYATPRQDGRLPIRLSELTTPDAYALAVGIQTRDIAHASNTGVPQSISTTYAPRLSNRQDGGVVELGDGTPEPALQHRAFRDLPLDPSYLLLGTNEDGSHVMRRWSNVTAFGVGGLPNTGKSWTLVSVVLQAVAAGHRVVLLDPHAANDDSLTARLAPVVDALWHPPAVTESEQVGVLEMVDRTIRQRGEGVDQAKTPYTIIVDEWLATQLGGSARETHNYLQSIVVEGRKFGVRSFVASQQWGKEQVGHLRNSLADSIVHRIRRDEARIMTGWPVAKIPDTMSLADGEAFVMDAADAVHVASPHLSEMDVAAFAGASQGRAASSVRPTSVRVGHAEAAIDPGGTDAGPGRGKVRPESLDGLDARERQALIKYVSGMNAAEVTDWFADTKARNGGKWKRNRQHIEELTRQVIRGEIDAAQLSDGDSESTEPE